MKRVISALLLVILLSATVFACAVPASAGVVNPYGVKSVGCITDISMKSYEQKGGVDYFTATVTSHIQGLAEREKLPYNVYGAIGSDKSSMFVYSVGNDTNLTYSNKTVKDIVEAFEKENPAWNAVAAINGDFFDIETSKTPDLGEPEGWMIQMGDAYKAYGTDMLGRGVVGVTDKGEMLYYTYGGIYSQNQYGTSLFTSGYNLQLLGEHKTNSIKSYNINTGSNASLAQLSFVTPHQTARDLSGTNVAVVKCDTYRRAHISYNGSHESKKGSFFFEGEIIEIRQGQAEEKPEEGYVLVSIPEKDMYSALKTGSYVRSGQNYNINWRDVTNAIGFKQQILAEGTILLKNAYGTYNTKGDKEETLKWTEDIYDYPYCWKNRTAIGFKEDGTPVILALQKSLEGAKIGASYYEIGEQFKALGCTNAFLLDGGGSTTFVLRNASGGFDTVFNGEPSGGENGRRVANAVILAVRDESVPLPEQDEVLDKKPEKPKKTEQITESESTVPATEPTKSGCKSVVSGPVLITVCTVTAVGTIKSRNTRIKKKI